MPGKKNIKFSVYPIQSDTSVFPEVSYDYVPDPDKKKLIGIAFSGGGSRSSTLTLGYLRKLHELKYLQKADYISAVSGGSWATSIYTFAETQKYSDEDLLGDSIQPDMCTLQFLKSHDPGLIGRAVQNLVTKGDIAKKFLNARTRMRRKWQELVGTELLKNVGLTNKIMIPQDMKQRVIESHKGCKVEKELTAKLISPRVGRPFLIINANLGGPKDYTNGWGNPLQFTPLYSGVPYYREGKKMVYDSLSYWEDLKSKVVSSNQEVDLNQLYDEEMNQRIIEGKLELTIGGGGVDTYAFGTTNGKS